MGKSVFKDVLGTARTIKSVIGLADFFVKQANRFTSVVSNDDPRLLDSYAGKNILFYPRKSQNRRWERFSNITDEIRKRKIIEAWLVIAEAKIEPIKQRMPKSQMKDTWKDHLEGWQDFIAKCRQEKLKLN